MLLVLSGSPHLGWQLSVCEHYDDQSYSFTKTQLGPNIEHPALETPIKDIENGLFGF